MMSLRLLSVLAIVLPAIIGFVITSQKSFVVSWIFAIAAIASIPLIGLPLGIGINLRRLGWPLPFVIPIVLLLGFSTLGCLFPKGQGGADRLFIPFFILIVEYAVCLYLPDSSADWSIQKRFLVSALMVLPISIGAVRGLFLSMQQSSKAQTELDKKSVHLGKFVFRPDQAYDHPESFFATYKLDSDGTKNLVRNFSIDLFKPTTEIKDAESRAKKYSESKSGSSTQKKITLPSGKTVIAYQSKFSDGRTGLIVILDSTKGILGYWLTWQGISEQDMKSETEILLAAVDAHTLPLPHETEY